MSAAKQMAMPDNVQRPDTLLALAIQQNADVEKLEKLMALQERWNAQQAKTAYYEAVAAFQATCPMLKRTKKVAFNKTEYHYAPLSEIVETIREPLRASGLSYRWEIEDKDSIVVTCIITHTAGHAERTSMSALPDDSGAKNLIQQRGSSVSYLQRYTLIGGLGITSADTDDDGQSSGEFNIERLMKHTAAIREHWPSVVCIKEMIACNSLSPAAEAWFQLSEEIKKALWIAPAHGGIFTTKERDVMKSAEFRLSYFGSSDEKDSSA